MDRYKKEGALNPASRSRRRFVTGLAAGGALAVAGPFGRLAWAASDTGKIKTMQGTEFDLAIGSTPVNFTGKERHATTVNGGVPGPLLRMREGTTVTLRVTNRLAEDSSIHWHGLILPFEMDGVPSFSFPGIGPGETFTYQFKVQQSGTYWYHSHSRFQEQTGVYGPIVIDPAGPDPIQADRDYVVMLSDWTDDEPEWIFRRLKQSSDFFNYQMPTVGDFFQDVRQMGLSKAFEKRRMWDQMRMNPTDLGDVSGATFTYLTNGTSPAGNWTAIARPGERVRLRFINGAATSIFDVRIPGLKMTVVSADGQNVEPVTVDEFRISVAETYDVVVQMPDDRAYTIFAQSIDRSGYTRGTLAPRLGMSAAVPEMDPKTWLSMVDMGMGNMPGHDMGAMNVQGSPQPSAAMGQSHPPGGQHGGAAGTTATSPSPGAGHAMHDMPGHTMGGATPGAAQAAPSGMAGHDMSAMNSQSTPASAQGGGNMAGHTMEGMAGMSGHDMSSMQDMTMLGTEPGVDSRSMAPSKSLSDPGPRLRDNGRRVLTYADLRTIGGPIDQRPPSREITLRLTGNMQRFIWGFDGKKFHEAEPVYFKYGERLRVTLINDSMMNHPIHLHGMWSEVENENGQFQVRKHTVNVQPGKQLTFQVTADAIGQWAFHCHLLYHMEAGMFRKVIVA
ncbi:copper resistance system multicopper oxidase [Noviherbaspirillum sp. CPCC 100848]|uniref:Copper resistance system multicopper oxidase n=1 Tax=Noviherbaspirillum album TaxID=3080276 RepID=A0ABU6JIG7_9BURK|nr:MULTISPECIES: copper resistance system multicopper oxidase [Noviherbaspirillum]MEC4722864.1 copper resistance system multicopper oxidase [Noviherbaspirillum sp. CPCC 100848]